MRRPAIQKLISVTLRDDDAENDENARPVSEILKERDEKEDVGHETRKRPSEVQPSGRVIGVVKRNWRA